MTPSLLDFLKRAAIGFIAGFILTCFVLLFLGYLPLSRDLNQLELDKQNGYLWMAFYIACGVAVISAVAGRLRLSRFWLWFCLAFGAICVVPFWPGMSGNLMPLATPYVNFGFQATYAVILAIYVGVAMTIAAAIQWIWPHFHKRFGINSRSTPYPP